MEKWFNRIISNCDYDIQTFPAAAQGRSPSLTKAQKYTTRKIKDENHKLHMSAHFFAFFFERIFFRALLNAPT
jgi:hypothetical protein